MKFYNSVDEEVFKQELASTNLSEGEFLKRRKVLLKGMKDRKKSLGTKLDWKKNRFKLMRGIKRFHKSNRGKRFHRDLGRFLATRELKGLAYKECQELVVPVTACLTHAYHELEWYMNIEDGLEYEIFIEELYDEVLEILTKLKTHEPDLSSHREFLYRVVEPDSLMAGLSERYNRPKEDIEKLWEKEVEVTKGNMGVDDSRFYTEAVGSLKRLLYEFSKRPRVQK
jgi:hypothetical protein